MGTRGWDTIGHGREMHGDKRHGREIHGDKRHGQEMHGDKRRQNSFLFSFYLLKSNDYAVGIQQTNGANVW